MVSEEYHAAWFPGRAPGGKPEAVPGALRLWSVASRATRVRLALAVPLGVAGRVTSVVAAGAVSTATLSRAALLGGVAFVLLVGFRAALAAARIRAEGDLYRAGARAMVESDVLDVPDEDPARVLLEGNFHARAVLVETTPALVANAAALVLLVPFVASSMPGRLLGVSLASAVAFVLASLPARRVNAALQRDVIARYDAVADGVSAAAEARLEIAARAGEASFARALDAIVDRYAVAARRNAVAGALATRAPLAAACALAAVIAAVDDKTRDVLRHAAMGDGLLVAALGAMAFELAVASQELFRARARVAPFLALLARPARAELARPREGPVPASTGTFTFEHVSFAYAASAARVLDALDLAWKAGAPLVLAGPNGAGKSTVLRLLLALRAPDAGSVRLAGEDLCAIDVLAVRRSAVLLPQRPYLGEPHTDVRTSFRLACGDVEDARLETALVRVGLRGDDATLARRIGELSVGQRQRLALARVLVSPAELVLLDEPDANLDREGVALVRELVLEMSRAGKRVAIAAHGAELLGLDAHVVELSRASR